MSRLSRFTAEEPKPQDPPDAYCKHCSEKQMTYRRQGEPGALYLTAHYARTGKTKQCPGSHRKVKG